MATTTTRRRTTTRPTRSTAAKTGGRPSAITSLSDRKSYKKWLVFGETGAGKTVLGGTAPNALFLTFESEGTESAKVHGSDAQEWVMNSRADILEAYEYFDVGSGCDDFEWVIIDSTSEMEECFWRDQLRAMKEAKGAKRSLYKPALDDYPIVWNKMKAEIDRWNRLPVNVLWTAQVLPLTEYDEDGEEFTTNLPLLGSLKNGVLARKVCGMVSLVGYLDTKRKKTEEGVEEWRRMYVSRRPGIMAKNRYGWGAWVDDPTIPSLATAADSSLAGTKPAGTTATRRRPRRSA